VSNVPWHPLTDVKALVAADKFDLGVTSAVNRILPHLNNRTLRGVREFAQAVVSRLRPVDFTHRVNLPRKPPTKGVTVHDVYAARVDAVTVEAHLDGSHKTTWYVKHTIVSVGSRKVFVLSLHCLMDPIRRADGTTLSPTWKESQ
jgi:hypothetical protein